MNKLFFLLSGLILFYGSNVKAEQVYYCTSEINIGIIYDKKIGGWRKGNFQEKRYTIKFNESYTELKGLEDSTMNCLPAYFGAIEKVKYIYICNSGYNNGSSFHFDRLNLRFASHEHSIAGYLINEPIRDTNNVYMGTCQKF